jgi:F-type H+-transporting ATPase subunit b
MRMFVLASLLVLGNATAVFAQEHGAEAPSGGGLMSLQVNLMFWTLLIFGVLFFILKRYAFGPITAAVEEREKALEDAIEGAKRDRDAAAKLLEEHRAKIDAARDEAQKLIAEGRALSEKMRQDMLEQTRREQQELLQRARQEIESERDKAIMQLRREAVDLALAGASKVIEQNLDSSRNRQLVESYLSSLGTLNVSRQ